MDINWRVATPVSKPVKRIHCRNATNLELLTAAGPASMIISSAAELAATSCCFAFVCGHWGRIPFCNRKQQNCGGGCLQERRPGVLVHSVNVQFFLNFSFCNEYLTVTTMATSCVKGGSVTKKNLILKLLFLITISSNEDEPTVLNKMPKQDAVAYSCWSTAFYFQHLSL